MKKLIFYLLSLLLLSCQTLPIIHSEGNETFVCPFPFAKENYRWVHAIEYRMPGNLRSSVIGATVIEPATRSVSCAVMTAEGMVLFEAEAGPRGLQVKRALPPFDSNDVAKKMMEDIELIFLAPQGKPQRGYLSDTAKVCRYPAVSGDWIDVIGEPSSNHVQIRRYSSDGVLTRQVHFTDKKKNLYQRIELQAHDIYSYSLVMELLEAKRFKKELKR